ncbi:LCP family protein [Lentibacillus sediminis]|uniref:LCP family glycopolymer transferase n=1 Tax=Lentibacillus sediminis TaxID=1940529 RepID=UPI000C1BD18E|nr:LCP family protein [Lentibacillus sediminis]
MTGKRSTQLKKPKRLWLKITLITLGVMFVLAGSAAIYAYSIYDNAKVTVNEQMHQKVTEIDPKVTKQKVSEQEPLNILLLGVDKRANDTGRSDALMVLSLDPKNDKMQLVSIPRDTRTTMVGKGFEDKINHAYAFGGTDMSISTVESLLDIELDYYVEMNMEGLADMVDAVGGITVNNDLDWHDGGYHFKKGEITLNGPQTMKYVRMRYQDPDGDFGRTERQRQVIQAVIDKGANIASVNKLDDMIDVLGNNMSTNMDFADMRNLLLNYNSVRHNAVSYMMQGSGTTIDGTYYYIVPDEEVAKVHEMIVGVGS